MTIYTVVLDDCVFDDEEGDMRGFEAGGIKAEFIQSVVSGDQYRFTCATRQPLQDFIDDHYSQEPELAAETTIKEWPIGPVPEELL